MRKIGICLENTGRVHRRCGEFTVILTALFTLFAVLPALAGTGLDTSFATTGKLVFRASPNSNGTSFARAVGIDGNGRIVVAGSGYVQGATTNGLAVARFNPDGTPDTSFGAGSGFVVVPFSNGGNFVESRVQAVAFQSDGKILLAGYTVGFGVVTRLNSNGSLDASFATNASFVSTFGGSSAVLNAIYVLPDNSMYVAGVVSTSRFLLAKLSPGGSLDTSFGTGGVTSTSFGGAANATSMAVNPANGSIVLGGYFTSSNNHSAVARYLNTGVLDTTFGTGGKVTTSVPGGQLDTIYKIFVQANGVVTGIGLYVNESGRERHMLLRYTAAGTPDAAFGTNGIAGGYFGNNQEFLYGGAALSDGKFLAVGFSSGTIGTRVSLFRYNSNGTVDRTFGCSGAIYSTTAAASNTMYAYDLAVQSNGRVVAAGQGTNSTILQGNFAVYRFLNPSTPTQCSAADYDGDGISELSVVRPNNGSGNAVWYRNNSTGLVNFFHPFADQFGLTADKLAPGDYDGDGRLDVAVYRDGTWYILQSSDRSIRIAVFGVTGDLPLPGDFDGDGRADIAVFRPSDGNWYVSRSSDGQFVASHWGQSGDVPMIGDFDADHKTDLAVWRPSTGAWYVSRSSDGQTQADVFGQMGDIPVAGDFNGSGKTDYAVFRPSNGYWYIANLAGVPAQNFTAIQFGQNGDIPAVGDYDGDSKADVAVFRNGIWFMQSSSNGQVGSAQFGTAGDIPVESAFTH